MRNKTLFAIITFALNLTLTTYSCTDHEVMQQCSSLTEYYEKMLTKEETIFEKVKRAFYTLNPFQEDEEISAAKKDIHDMLEHIGNLESFNQLSSTEKLSDLMFFAALLPLKDGYKFLKELIAIQNKILEEIENEGVRKATLQLLKRRIFTYKMCLWLMENDLENFNYGKSRVENEILSVAREEINKDFSPHYCSPLLDFPGVQQECNIELVEKSKTAKRWHELDITTSEKDYESMIHSLYLEIQ